MATGIYDLKFDKNSLGGSKLGNEGGGFSGLVKGLGGKMAGDGSGNKAAIAGSVANAGAGVFGSLQKDPQAYGDDKGYTAIDSFTNFMGSDPNDYDQSSEFSERDPYADFSTNQIDPYKHDTKSVVSTIGESTLKSAGQGAMFGLPGMAIGGVLGLGQGIGTSILNKKKSGELDEIQANAENQYYTQRANTLQAKSAKEQQQAADQELYGRANTHSMDQGSIYNIG